LLIVAGLLLVLKHLGFELTTVVAGLSIGGVAIAFAAQKTIENLFGTVMVITDQPIRVGDFCQAGNIEGTVEISVFAPPASVPSIVPLSLFQMVNCLQ
jgi:MscS family membrane protein